MEQDPTPGLKKGLIALALLFLALQVIEAGNIRAIRGDETFYVEAGYTMLQSGDWMTPRRANGELRFEKPILTYWVVAAPMWLLGVGMAPARLPMIFLALGTVPFVYDLARLLLRNRTVAFLAAVIYLTLNTVYSNAHQARTDALLAFCVAASMCFFARVLFAPDLHRRDVLLAYACAAGAVLTKGFAGVVFTFLPLAVFLALAWRRTEANRRRAILSPWGLLLFVLLAAPWYVYSAYHHYQAFVGGFFTDQITTNVNTKQAIFLLTGLMEYPVLFLRDTLPWNVLAAIALIGGFGAFRAVVRERRMEWLFLLVWFGTAFLVFACGSYPRGRYLLPAMPAVALLAAAALAPGVEAKRAGRMLRWMVYLLAVAALAMVAAFVLMHAGVLLPTAIPAAGVFVALLLIVAGGLGVWAHRLQGWQAATGAGALAMMLMACPTMLFSAPAPSETLAVLARGPLAALPAEVPVAAAVGEGKVSDTIVLLYCGRRPSVFLSARPDQQAKALQEFLAQPGPRAAVVNDQAWATLPEDVLQRMQVLASRRDVSRPGLARPLTDSPRSPLRHLTGKSQTLHVLATSQ